jgi:hypothetical protein
MLLAGEPASPALALALAASAAALLHCSSMDTARRARSMSACDWSAPGAVGTRLAAKLDQASASADVMACACARVCVCVSVRARVRVRI